MASALFCCSVGYDVVVIGKQAKHLHLTMCTGLRRHKMFVDVEGIDENIRSYSFFSFSSYLLLYFSSFFLFLILILFLFPFFFFFFSFLFFLFFMCMCMCMCLTGMSTASVQ